MSRAKPVICACTCNAQTAAYAAARAPFATGDESSSPTLHDRVARAETFITGLPVTAAPADTANGTQGSSSSSSSKPGLLLRGPALAAVELAKRKLLLGLGQQQQLAEALLQYHDRCEQYCCCSR
jgi:hypothetical protein